MVVKAEVFKQAFDDEPVTVIIDMGVGEYQRLDCDDCGGTGMFELYEVTTSMECGVCKGAGTVWFNVY